VSPGYATDTLQAASKRNSLEMTGSPAIASRTIEYGSSSAGDGVVRRRCMYVTIVEGAVEAAREDDLRSAWEDTTSAALPDGFVESSLLRAGDGTWRIVTMWESRETVMAMRASGERPAALIMFERAGSEPSVSMWTVEGQVTRT
jgi:heme-degrading monooxygenase HmoA